MKEKEIVIDTPVINLDKLLKWVGIAETGGQAGKMITGGMVKLNGLTVKERRKKVRPGDILVIERIGCLKIVAEQG